MVQVTPRMPSRSLWRIALIGLLAGCLPEAAPFRCDLAGGDRACDSAPGSRCVQGSCASPVAASVCASGYAFSASAATPGRCAPQPTADAAADADAVDAPPSAALDAPTSDHPEVTPPGDLPTTRDVALLVDDPPPGDVSSNDLGAAPSDAATSDVTAVDVPADVEDPLSPSPPSPVFEVVGGFLHTCARLENGSVWCWGSNLQGQLGLDTAVTFQSTPTRVNLPPVVRIAAGAFHTCALTNSGETHCWGRNVERQLGVAAPRFAFAPVQVGGIPPMASLALGSSHSCARTAENAVYCWGNNTFGATSSSDTTQPASPLLVAGVLGRFLVAGDGFTCAGSTPTVWCWGRNAYGELGVSPMVRRASFTPQVITGALGPGSSLDELYAGGFVACARSGSGVRCWGRSDLGAIPGQTSAETQPAPVPAERYVSDHPVLGYVNQCAVEPSGAMRCWGANELGSDGNGAVTRSVAPAVTALPLAVARVGGIPVVGVGASHICAVEARGPLRCWGAHYFGQLGNGLTALFPTPVEVPSLRGATSLALGRAFTCALRGNASEVVCAGLNNLGQLGGSSGSPGALPAVETAPVTVTINRIGGSPLPPIQRLSTGAAHGCAVSASGRTFCWGFNQEGQVLPNLSAGTVVFGAFDVFMSLTMRAVFTGSTHTCALDPLSALRCWGSNDRGESGQPALEVRAVGQLVPGVSNVTAVAAGDRFTCVRNTAGRVECFGANDLGQCGTSALTPASISLVAQRTPAITAGADEITAGQQHACARIGGRVFCWGSNRHGQLGIPVTGTGLEPRPTLVTNLSGVAQVSAGGLFTCARVSGRIWCWGGSHHGQLGNGRFADSATPVEVALPPNELAVDVTAGEEHACARTESGSVYCWGSNHLGQLLQREPLAITRAEQGVVRWRR